MKEAGLVSLGPFAAPEIVLVPGSESFVPVQPAHLTIFPLLQVPGQILVLPGLLHALQDLLLLITQI